MNNSNEAGAARSQAIASIRDELRSCCERQKVELQKEEQNIATQREVADAQHMEALKLLGIYKERLGLAITRVAPQTVRMSFTLIDESSPGKEFYFTLGLTDSRRNI